MTQHTSNPLSLTSGVKLFAVAALSVAAATGAHASLLSYESFSGYTTGTQLDDQTAPAVTGYTGDWTNADFGTQEPSILSGSLDYTGAGYPSELGDRAGVASNGGGNTPSGASGRAYRLLTDGSSGTPDLTVDDSTTGTLYLSWLYQTGSATGHDVYQSLALWDGDTTDPNRSFDAGTLGSTSNYNFGHNGGSTTSTGVAIDTDVHLFVARFTLSDTGLSDSITLWVDPTSETGGTTISGVDLQWDRLGLSDYDDTSAAWDEIRWGTTFDAVVVPEPGTYALLAGLAALSFIAVRRRK